MSRLWNLFRKTKLDRQLDEEFQFHVDMLTEQYLKRGLTREQAEREARREFGAVEAAKDAYRDQRGWPWLEDWVLDLRHAVRLLLRYPGFSVVAVITMALGIGANSAVFSMVNAAFLRQVPYPNAARLVDIVRDARGQLSPPYHNSRRYLYFKERARTLEEVAASRGGGTLNLIRNGEAEPVTALRVSANFFRTLGIEPSLGRSFRQEEESPQGTAVAILSYSLWQQRFGGDPGILGQAIDLDGKPFTAVGVMPPHFIAIPRADVWIPLRPRPVNDGRNTLVFGLLRSGGSRGEASREVAQLIGSYRQDFPGEYREFAANESAAVAPFGIEQRFSSRPLWVLFGAVGLILLIACSNLANLLVARATGRLREIATRAALGAGRGRIVRQLLAESLLISVLGCVLGLVLASWTIPALVRMSPVPLADWSPVRVDWVVVTFTTALAVLTGMVFGLFPALQVARLDLNDCMKASGTTSTPKRATGRLRRVIVAGEVALSLVLMIGAGLLIRTFAGLVRTPLGVDPAGVLAGRMSLQSERYKTTAQTAQLFHRGLDRFRQHPEVEAAAIASDLPLERGMNLVAWIPGTPDAGEPRLTDWRYVSPDYFSLLRIPLLAGRLFTEADGPQAAPVVLINQQFVKQYFGKENPIGRVIHVMQHTPEPDRPRVVVGVVGDVKSNEFKQAAKATVFVPFEQARDGYLRFGGGVHWLVRSRGAGNGLVAFMQKEMKAIDPLLPFVSFQTLEEVRERGIHSDRSIMILLASFAALAVLLAAVGIYGVISYLVAQRTSEIGIRIALGASRPRIVRSIVMEGIGLAGAGIVLGIAGALLLTRFLQSFVFGVKTTDPLTFALAASFLLAIATIACLAPALRIARLDPMRALRAE